MKFDKSPLWLVKLFETLQQEVGGDPRRMFGYPAAFENGNMFAGLFGDHLFVRLSDDDRAKLLAMPGAGPLTVMPNRPSKHSVTLPPSMLEDEEAVKEWLQRSLAHARTLPPKVKKVKARKAPKAKKSR